MITLHVWKHFVDYRKSSYRSNHFIKTSTANGVLGECENEELNSHIRTSWRSSAVGHDIEGKFCSLSSV